MPAAGHDWALLRKLRDRFLSGSPGTGDYWESPELLAAYDATFAQRIAWKWYAVLADLGRLGWQPPTGLPLQDWGCGSGVAGRVALDAFGQEQFSHLALWDKSPTAVRFAMDRAQARFPGIRVTSLEPGPIGLLVISHVINELSPEQRHELLEIIGRAQTVIWVEPGTHDESRRLGAVREQLRDTFRIVSPCPHQAACPVLAADRSRDWCHFFAKPPTNAFTDPEWGRFSVEMGIDLRSLPYSHLVLDRRPGETPPGLRLLGRHGYDKVAVRTLACQPDGTLADRDFTHRGHKALCRLLDKAPHTNWIPA